MSLTRPSKLRKAIERKDVDKIKALKRRTEYLKQRRKNERGCNKCPEDSLFACFGEKCAKKCCGPPEGEYKHTKIVPIGDGKPKSQTMNRGGRKTRRKRRRKRRKSRKMRKKTKHRKKRKSRKQSKRKRRRR